MLLAVLYPILWFMLSLIYGGNMVAGHIGAGLLTAMWACGVLEMWAPTPKPIPPPEMVTQPVKHTPREEFELDLYFDVPIQEALASYEAAMTRAGTPRTIVVRELLEIHELYAGEIEEERLADEARARRLGRGDHGPTA